MVSPLVDPFGKFETLRGLRAYLSQKIRGQEQVLDRVSSLLIRGEMGLAHPGRPLGSFLFVGPTGVGKTETVNAYTSYLFDGARPVRFDMSEYQLQSSVEKLIGASPIESGLLGRAVAKSARGALLFDEIEKAHPLVLDLFLQVLDDARITVASGEVLDLSGFYCAFTSNIGSEETMRMENAPMSSVERTVLMRVRDRLRPELLGRINEIVVFGRLNYSSQRAICEDMIQAEVSRLKQLGNSIVVTPGAVEFLIREGYHRMLGARPMRATVDRFIQDAVARALLSGSSGNGELIADSRGLRLVAISGPPS